MTATPTDDVLFVGRGWVFEAVRKWLAGDGTVLLITGRPGAGKTAVYERLVAGWPAGTILGAEHRCRANEDVTRNVRRFVSSVAGQLAYRLPGFRDELERVLATEADVRAIHLEGTATAGTVTGLQAGVYVDLRGTGPADLADRLLRRPLEAWSLRNPGARPVVAVDAFDESLGFAGEANLLAPVRSLRDTALRWVVTSRNVGELDVLKDAARLDLIDDLPAEVDDVREYVAARLPGDGTLVDRIAAAANGVFLFAQHVVVDLLADPGRMAAAIADPAGLKLPADLAGVYHSFLERDLRRTDSTDAARKWVTVYQPLLSFLAVAAEPGLTVSQLQYLLTGDPTRADVENALTACRQFLDAPAAEGPWRLYHQSFRDALLQAGSGIADPADCHRSLAQALVAQWAGSWDEADGYALAHTVAHHAGALSSGSLPTRLARELSAQAVDLVAADGFTAARFRSGEGALLADTELALQAAIGGGDAVAITTAAGLVLWRRLRTSTSASQGGAPARLAAAGRFDEALAQADTLPWHERQEQLLVIVEALAKAGDDRVGPVLEAASVKRMPRRPYACVAGLAGTLLEHGYDDHAFELAGLLSSGALRGGAARIVAAAGRPDGETVERALAVLDRLGGWDAAQLRVPLLHAAVAAGQVEDVVAAWPDDELVALAEAAADAEGPALWLPAERRLEAARPGLPAEATAKVAWALRPGQPEASRSWTDLTLDAAAARLRVDEHDRGAAEAYNQAVALLSEFDLGASALAARSSPSVEDSRFDRAETLAWVAARAVEEGDAALAARLAADAQAGAPSYSLMAGTDVAGLLASGSPAERAGRLRDHSRIGGEALLVATSAGAPRGSIDQLARALERFWPVERLPDSLRRWPPAQLRAVIGAVTSPARARELIDVGVEAGVLRGEDELALIAGMDDPGQRALALAAAAARRGSLDIFGTALAEPVRPEVWTERGWMASMVASAAAVGGGAVDAVVQAVTRLDLDHLFPAVEPLAEALAAQSLPAMTRLESVLALPLDGWRRGRVILAAGEVTTAVPWSNFAEVAARAAVQRTLIGLALDGWARPDVDRLRGLVPDPSPEERVFIALVQGPPTEAAGELPLRAALRDIPRQDLTGWMMAESGRQLATREDELKDWISTLGPGEQVVALSLVVGQSPDLTARWLPVLRAALAREPGLAERFRALVGTAGQLRDKAPELRASLLEEAAGLASAGDFDGDRLAAAIELEALGLAPAAAMQLAAPALDAAEADRPQTWMPTWTTRYLNEVVAALEGAATQTPLVMRVWQAVWRAAAFEDGAVDHGLVALIALARAGMVVTDAGVERLLERWDRSPLGPTLVACLAAVGGARPPVSVLGSIDGGPPGGSRPSLLSVRLSGALPPTRVAAALRYHPGLADDPELWGQLVRRIVTPAEVREALTRIESAAMLEPLVAVLGQLRPDDSAEVMFDELLDVIGTHASGAQLAGMIAIVCRSTRDEYVVFNAALLAARTRGSVADVLEGAARVLAVLASGSRGTP